MAEERSIQYIAAPEPAGRDPAELFDYILQELQRLSAIFTGEYSELRLEELNAEPARPRDGTIVLADGVNWNPGSGAGIYARYGGAWVKL